MIKMINIHSPLVRRAKFSHRLTHTFLSSSPTIIKSLTLKNYTAQTAQKKSVDIPMQVTGFNLESVKKEERNNHLLIFSQTTTTYNLLTFGTLIPLYTY